MQDNRTKALEDAFGDAALNLILDEYAGESGAQLLKEYEHRLSEKTAMHSRRAVRESGCPDHRLSGALPDDGYVCRSHSGSGSEFLSGTHVAIHPDQHPAKWKF